MGCSAILAKCKGCSGAGSHSSTLTLFYHSVVLHLGRQVGGAAHGRPVDKSLGVVPAITYSTYVRTHNASDVTVNGNADEVTLLEEIDMDGQNAVAGESREFEWQC